MVGFLKKFSYFVILKKWRFCKKILAQFSYKQCFYNTFKVVNMVNIMEKSPCEIDPLKPVLIYSKNEV